MSHPPPPAPATRYPPALPLLAALLGCLLAGAVAAKPLQKPTKPPRAEQASPHAGSEGGALPPASGPEAGAAAAATPPTPTPPVSALRDTPAAPDTPARSVSASPDATAPEPSPPATAAAPDPTPPTAATPDPIPAPAIALPSLSPPPPRPPATSMPRPDFPAQPAVPAVPGQFAGLAAWVGCAPNCAAAGARLQQRLRSNFVLQFPPLRAELERMLGRRPFQDLLRLAETGPAIDRRDDWVRVALCRQESCSTAFMVLFVHLAAGEVVLCWHEERWEAARLRWSENRGGVWRSGMPGRQPLPPEGCNNRGPLGGHDWNLLARLADG